MSFSFSANGNPKNCIATVGQQAASTPQVPQEFADAISNQLSGLPAHASVSLSAYGHTGWGEGQTQGEISLHLTMQVAVGPLPEDAPAAEEADEAEAGDDAE